MSVIPKLPDVPEDQNTELVSKLLDIIRIQQESLQQLRDEIARLKGQKPKPTIKPSQLEQSGKGQQKDGGTGKRPGSLKKSKTEELQIHETKKIRPEGIPPGSRFKGYQDYVVQDMFMQLHNTNYRLECWKTPDNEYLTGKLPVEVSSHFGSTLVTYILHQYYHAHVTQPLILEQLLEFGVMISAGQVNGIITEGKEPFHIEKDEILKAGLEVSGHINVDDTGARHRGRNGYCTHIGNELFAWFQSTQKKNRINFLELLRAGHRDYVVNLDAVNYMEVQGLPLMQLAKFDAHCNARFENLSKWEEALQALDITNERHVRIATEGVLLGSLLDNGFNKALVIVSDDAGQFNVLLHALCWIHAERSINKLVGLNSKDTREIEEVRGKIWDFYAALKAYKRDPSKKDKVLLDKRFDDLFTAKTSCVSLKLALQRLYNNKKELLLVLEYPDIPLHNNLSENDIREYVKKRKISGSTRSDSGRRCRDTFTSLKKTCRKLGVSFWAYLKDRVTHRNDIARLPDLIRAHSS
jgi:Transposase IS66 family